MQVYPKSYNVAFGHPDLARRVMSEKALPARGNDSLIACSELFDFLIPISALFYYLQTQENGLQCKHQMPGSHYENNKRRYLERSTYMKSALD
jgi:hypothetical protein